MMKKNEAFPHASFPFRTVAIFCCYIDNMLKAGCGFLTPAPPEHLN